MCSCVRAFASAEQQLTILVKYRCSLFVWSIETLTNVQTCRFLPSSCLVLSYVVRGYGSEVTYVHPTQLCVFGVTSCRVDLTRVGCGVSTSRVPLVPVIC